MPYAGYPGKETVMKTEFSSEIFPAAAFKFQSIIDLAILLEALPDSMILFSLGDVHLRLGDIRQNLNYILKNAKED